MSTLPSVKTIKKVLAWGTFKFYIVNCIWCCTMIVSVHELCHPDFNLLFLSCLHFSLQVVISPQFLSHFFLQVNSFLQIRHSFASFHLPWSITLNTSPSAMSGKAVIPFFPIVSLRFYYLCLMSITTHALTLICCNQKSFIIKWMSSLLLAVIIWCHLK